MNFRRLEVLDDAHHVGAEVLVELQRPFIVVGVAVAARVPGGGAKALGEEFDLVAPVAPVAADAVQEEQQRPAAGDRDGEPRRRLDEDGVQGYSALAPEIFTARERLSLSFLMYAANSPGEDPTTS